jgi:hypothetical protein
MNLAEWITSINFNKKKVFYLSVFLLLVYSTLVRIVDHRWKDVVMSDGKGYYAYLPALIIFHDLDYTYYADGRAGEHAKDDSSFNYFIDGGRVNKFPAGVALLQFPFFLLALLITFVTGFEMTGYSFFFQLFVSIAAIFYTLLGAKYLFRLLLSYKISEKRSLITTFIILFGTNLLNYVVFEPSMSHCYSFAAIAGFSFYLRKFFIDQKPNDWIKACIWLGIILLIRQINGIIIVGIPLIAGDYITFKEGALFLLKKPRTLFAGIICSFIILAIQPILWHAQNGHWIVWTYLDEGFKWDNPAILKVLFSYRKGWLLYTPLFLLLIPAFISQLIQKKWFLFFANIIFWSLLIYVISSWWCWYYGGSFGQRAFIDFYPLAGVSLGLLLNEPIRNFTKIITGILVFIIVIINLIQTYQYTNNIIHYDRMDKAKYWMIFLRIGSSNKFKVYENYNKNPPVDLPGPLIQTWFTDFDEGSKDWVNWRNDDIADEALSGNKVIILQKGNDNSPTLKVDISSDVLKNTALLINVWYKGEFVTPESELIISIDDTTGATPFRFSTKIKELKIIDKNSDWNKVQSFIKPDIMPYKGNYKLNAYLYNPGKTPMLFDDLAIFQYKEPDSSPK